MPPATPIAPGGADTSYCGKSSTIAWSPGGLDPTTGNVDSAADTVTICTGEGISSSGSLVALDYFAVNPGSTTIQVWRQAPTPTGYMLICKTDVTTVAKGLQHVPISPPCEIEAGDFPGFWQEGTGVVGKSPAQPPAPLSPYGCTLGHCSQSSAVQLEQCGLSRRLPA